MSKSVKAKVKHDPFSDIARAMRWIKRAQSSLDRNSTSTRNAWKFINEALVILGEKL